MATLMLEALGVRAALPMLLRALPLDRVLSTLTLEARGIECEGRERDALEAVERVTDTLTRRVRATRTACLKRALLRYALLRRRGVAVRFVIGVRPGGQDGFEAHAWITLRGRPIMEQTPPDYRPTFEWPPG